MYVILNNNDKVLREFKTFREANIYMLNNCNGINYTIVKK